MSSKFYVGTKLINALPMTRLEYNDYRGWDLPENEDGSDKGFLVEYFDGGQANHENHKGYISWSPEGVFKNTYRDTEEGVTFGYAVELLKSGCKVARKGWNGKGMFLYYVPEGEYQARTAAIMGKFENDLVPYGAYIAMKTAQDTVVPWLASQSDVLAEDWVIVE